MRSSSGTPRSSSSSIVLPRTLPWIVLLIVWGPFLISLPIGHSFAGNSILRCRQDRATVPKHGPLRRHRRARDRFDWKSLTKQICRRGRGYVREKAVTGGRASILRNDSEKGAHSISPHGVTDSETAVGFWASKIDTGRLLTILRGWGEPLFADVFRSWNSWTIVAGICEVSGSI